MTVDDVDLADAARFIGALTQSDGWTVPVTFQTFDDRAAKRPILASVINGALRDCARDLAYYNDHGAGVAVAVQRTDLRGRRMENVVAARALYIDCDTPNDRMLALPPSMIVQSAHGPHVYWLLKDGAPLQRIPDAQRQLARYYESDRMVGDVARVMRVPGFWHHKGAPYPVRLVAAHPDRRYELTAVLAAHPVEPATVLPHRGGSVPATVGTFRSWASCKSTTEGRRNHTAYVIAAEGLGRGIDVVGVASVVQDYCRRAGIPSEAETIIRSAERRHAREPFRPGAGR